MNIGQLIYEDGVVAVALASTPEGGSSLRLALRWLEPQSYRGRDQRMVETTNAVGGATDWFIVPLTFGAAIARTLVEQHAAGLTGFTEDGFAALVRWLVDDNELHDSMCY